MLATQSNANNNKLPSNLPQLQNLIKRDPASYEEEFERQYALYNARKVIFEQNPSISSHPFYELVMFFAQISHCYPKQLADYPEDVCSILRRHGSTLHPTMRLGLVKALVLLRNKNLLSPTALLQLFFRLLRSEDKGLRKFLKNHIVNDIKNINSKSKNVKLNKDLQNFMHEMLKDNHAVAIKTSLDILIDLYRKQIWNDAKTVNIICTALYSKVAKIMVTAVNFFIGQEHHEESEDESSDSEEESSKKVPNLKKTEMANRVNKTRRKKKRNLEKAKQALIKDQKKKYKKKVFDFSAIHLINDPQQVAEKLFKKLDRMNERFEIKIMTMNLISRLIGLHELYLPGFYTFIQRYLFVNQRDVTKIMTYSAQAAHPLVPPSDLEPVVKSLANNFVTERYSGEVMAMGLNAIRELCARNPFCMDEDLLHDLALYRSHKDKAVSMASRSLIGLFREKNPDLLIKKHRGAASELTKETIFTQYGELEAKTFIPGAEILAFQPDESDMEGESSDDGQWIDVSSEDEPVEKNKPLSQREIKKRKKKQKMRKEKKEGKPKEMPQPDAVREVMKMTVEERAAKSEDIVTSRCLNDEDFARIDAAQAAKVAERYSKAKKRKPETDNSKNPEIVSLKSIEMVHKKRKHDKISRLNSIIEGRLDRGKFGSTKGRMNPNASTTNREKGKKKNFSMMKHKIRFGKTESSFKDKKEKLKKSLLKQKTKQYH